MIPFLFHDWRLDHFQDSCADRVGEIWPGGDDRGKSLFMWRELFQIAGRRATLGTTLLAFSTFPKEIVRLFEPRPGQIVVDRQHFEGQRVALLEFFKESPKLLKSRAAS